MKTTTILTAVLCVQLPHFGSNNGYQNPSAQASQSQTIHLFNGHTLDGWYTFLQHRGRDNDPKGVFRAQNGMIRISGEEWGCITTLGEYENYHLITEFKWGEVTYPPREQNARDSGILLHSQGVNGGSEGIWMHSIECQVIEGGTGDFIVVGDGSERFQITCTVAPERQGGSHIFHPAGQPATISQGRINWFGRDPEWQDRIGFRGRQDIEYPAGEWNRLECITNDGDISILLNGVLVNRAFEVKPRSGRIQIQSEGAEIFFRRMDLIAL